MPINEIEIEQLPSGQIGITLEVQQVGPQGPTGPANTLSIGSVTSGETPSATLTGTAPTQTLNLVLPKGSTGLKGDQGQIGETGPAGPSGPNSVTTSTSSNLNGYIFGNGTNIGGSTAGTALATPNTIVLRDASSGSSFNELKVIESGTGNFVRLRRSDGAQFDREIYFPPPRSSVNGSLLLEEDAILQYENGIIAGNKTFTGQTELVTQAATNGTSAMTRGLSDARYGSLAAALTTGFNSDQNTTVYKTVTPLSFMLGVGKYYIEAILVHNGNATFATNGVKDRILFTGAATATGTVHRATDSVSSAISAPNGLLSTGNVFAESSISNRSQTTWRKGVINVTGSGELVVQIAQAVAGAAANTTLAAGSSVIIYPIPS